MDETGTADDTTVANGPAGPGATEGVDDSVTPRPRRRRVRLWRWALRGAVWGIALVLVLGIAFLTQTARGQRLVLDEILDRAGGYLAGELTVESIRSATLIFGLTLRGVRLDAAGGRPFLTADSVVVRYSPLSLAMGSPRIRSTTLYGVSAEISRYPGDDFTNVNRIAASRPDAPAGSPVTVGLGRVSIRGGTLAVLTPAGEAPSERTIEGPDGARLRRMALEDLDVDIERTVVRTDGPVMVDARLASFSASIFVREEPLVVREAQGNLTFGDRGLRIEAAAVRLPGSYLEGGMGLGPDRPGDPWVFTADFRSDEWGDLADIAWVDPRIPQGQFRGEAELRVENGIRIALSDVDVRTEGSTLALEGGVTFADVMSMESLRVTAQPLQLAVVDPWLEEALPLRGSVRGSATLSGTVADLSAIGRMTFTPDGLPESITTADFSGTLHSGADPGGTSLSVRLQPLDYRILEPFWPDAARLGTGSATVSVDGRADDGMLVVADALHRSNETTTSRVVGRGTVRRAVEGAWIVDARGEVAPLSLPLLGRLWPRIDLPGEVRGPLRIDGRLTDLHIGGDLTADAGRAVFDLTADMTDPGAGYLLDADVEALDLSAFTSAVPTPSVLSGHVSLDGSGLVLDSLVGTAVLALRSARVGALAVDSVQADVRADRGLLSASDVQASVAGILIEGGGTLGMVAGRPGEARFAFSADSLAGLRPVFMGDSILVADTLNPLEQDALRARGIDPDTLPTSMDVRLEGVVRGTADLSGWMGDLDLDLLFDLTSGAYGHNSVDSARVSLMASDLPETMGAWDVEARAHGLVWEERDFEEVRFDGAMNQRRGDGTLDVVRTANESYHLAGVFALDSLGGELQLNEADLQLNERSWILTRPTFVAWNESSVTVDSLDVRRAGEDPMLVTAAGTLTRGGDSDFRMVLQGFHIEQALRIAQREDIDLAGHVDLDLTVSGAAERPVIQARFEVLEPRYGPVRLTRIEGALDYENRAADIELSAWVDDSEVLTGEGMVPVDLALTDVETRTVEEQMDLTLRADSLDAALALVYLSALEDVVGTVSAEMRVRGTPIRPEPSGTVTLTRAGWTIDAIGVRHTGISGELLLQPNGAVGIKLAAVGPGGSDAGSSNISGLVRLDPITNPTLDLSIGFDRFVAVDRRDMQGRISGNLALTGRYRLPVAEGTLRLDEATLNVEEFARNADVVDLRSPLMYAPGIAVDTTVFVSQPVLAGLDNPFLDNLRVDVDLEVPRNLWLRSPQMNVELGGNLIVAYDRGEGDLVLVGELQALRGSYSVFGRTFEVDGGTAAFLGQPGVNPTLDFQALSRVRRREGGRLEVRANVGGTLVDPVVTLTTEEAGLSQSDLVSYLVFGQSSAEAGAAGLDLQEVGISYVTGTLANQLGTAIAQEIPLVNTLDYLSFSQAVAAGQGTGYGPASQFGNTQVELGKYLNDQVFVIFVLGGSESDESGTSLQLRGVRLELAVTESLFLEAFMEDRFLRGGSALGTTDLDGDEILGVFVFGEWGFGSNQQD